MIFLYVVLDLDTFFKKCDFLEKFVLSFFFEQDLCFDNICFCSASLGINNVLVFEIAR